MGSDIDGEAAFEHSSWSISLNNDGTIIAIGARYNKDDGNDYEHVRLHQWDSSTW